MFRPGRCLLPHAASRRPRRTGHAGCSSIPPSAPAPFIPSPALAALSRAFLAMTASTTSGGLVLVAAAGVTFKLGYHNPTLRAIILAMVARGPDASRCLLGAIMIFAWLRTLAETLPPDRSKIVRVTMPIAFNLPARRPSRVGPFAWPRHAEVPPNAPAETAAVWPAARGGALATPLS